VRVHPPEVGLKKVDFQPLPHAFPFRFADGVIERTGPAQGRVRATVTADAAAVRETGFPAAALAELVAQSALLLEGGDAALGRKGFLAGISDFLVERLPVPGDVLTVDVAIAGRLGDAVKFEGVVTDGEGGAVARGAVTVKQGIT
jgi:3-hydroxymyristoyl/3-hydroxydecanoyl-(acyl carrier protein) dehydratase